MYGALFTGDESRIKHKVGASSDYYWWTRHATSSGTTFYRVSTDGSGGNGNTTNSYGIALGFCM